MPDLIIFLVGLFAFVPFLAGLALMVMMAARSSQQVEIRKRPNVPLVPASRVDRD